MLRDNNNAHAQHASNDQKYFIREVRGQQEPSLTPPPASRCFSRLEAAELEADTEPDVDTLDLEAVTLAERVMIWSTMGKLIRILSITSSRFLASMART